MARAGIPVVLLLALSLPSTAWAACEAPTARADVALPVATAIRAFGNLEADAFKAAREKAIAALPCMSVPMSPDDAAQFHALMALEAFLRQDDTGAVNAFRSVLAANPSWVLPLDLVPPDHPIRLQIQVASTLKGSQPRSLPNLAPDVVLVDGMAASTAPQDRPTVLQRVGPDGHVVETVWVPANGPLPPWAPLPRPTAASAVAPQRHPIALAGASGVALVAAAACYGLAAVTYEDFLHPDTESGYPDDPSALRARANGLTWVSIGTGALGLGLGVATIVRW